MNAEDCKRGTLVTLVTLVIPGSPRMVVVGDVTSSLNVDCVWFDTRNRLHRSNFWLGLLMPAGVPPLSSIHAPAPPRPSRS